MAAKFKMAASNYFFASYYTYVIKLSNIAFKNRVSFIHWYLNIFVTECCEQKLKPI